MHQSVLVDHRLDKIPVKVYRIPHLGHFEGQLGSAPSSLLHFANMCANAQTLTMADAQTSPPPFAKSRSRLLSLDEVPHKRHLPPPVLSRENPLVPEPGTPAFAERKDQYAANTAAELRQEQETKRQQRKVCSSTPLSLARGYLPWCSPVQTPRQHVFAGIPEPKKTMPGCS